MHRLAIALTCCLAVSACGPGVSPPLPEWVRMQPGRCLLTRDLSESMETMAIRCAEQFIRHNGYTDAPPSPDSLRWVAEPRDDGTWPAILAERRGSLFADAEQVQCSRRQCFVFFRVRALSADCRTRAVTMTQVYTRIRLVPGVIAQSRCRGPLT